MISNIINNPSIMLLLNCFFIGGISYNYMESYFSRKLEISYITVFVLLILAKFLVVLFGNNILLNYASTILYFFVLSKFLYKSSNINIYFLTTIFVVFLFIAEVISMYLIQFTFSLVRFNNENYEMIFLNICSMSVFLILYRFITYLIKKKISQNSLSSYFEKTESLFLLFITFLIIVLSLISNSIVNNRTQLVIIIVCILLLLLSIYILITFDRNIRYRILNNEYQNSIEIYSQALDKYKIMLKQTEKEKRIIHDVKNHLNIIEKLYLSNNIEKAKLYFKDLKRNVIEDSIFFSSNPILQIILYELYQNCIDNEIEFNYNIDKRADLHFISDFDIVTIFSNMTKNAFEAIKSKSFSSYIDLKIRLVNQSIVIMMKNPYEKVRNVNGKYLTTKKSHSGIGLTNIESACEKYNGFLDINTENMEFSICVVIPLRNEGYYDSYYKHENDKNIGK